MEQNSDSYSYNRAQAWQLYADMLAGCSNGYILVVSETSVSSDAKVALQKSFDALGYGSDACTYLVATHDMLSDHDLMAAVESVDPAILIAADRASADFLASAYRCSVPSMTQLRVFGRRALAFDSLDALMATDDGHQKIWAALKTLPKIP